MFLEAPPHPCSLLSEKTSVQVSITVVRLWGCPTCQECASLTGVVTSMKTLDSPWLSQLPMNSDTGKGPRKLRSSPSDHASVSGCQENQIALWLENDFLNLCFLICKVGGGWIGERHKFNIPLSSLPDHLYRQHHRIIETTTSLWVRMRWAETRR